MQGSLSASALCDSSTEAKLIRKKSGQVVRSSLKSPRSVSQTSLSVLTFPSSSSKSEPTTPSSKAVHFDTKEHVKLFLAEQKPLAVSRDGSPTDDTSGTDSDFPGFIYGDVGVAGADGSSINKKTRLVMHVTNMPVRINPVMDASLEEFCLSPDGTTIQGKVRVRNLAFSKAVAVRFTFDQWQTTSEVTGRWVESLSPEWDRFGFAIRLNDLLARIEGKTLVLAVRYNSAGKEVWDNNGGVNYVATFSKVRVKKSAMLSDDEASTEELRSKLEIVAGSKERLGPAFVASSKKPSAMAPAPDFKSGVSFASRYDFSNSLKSPWKPADAAANAKSPIRAVALHSRTQSFPVSSKANSMIPWPTQAGLSQPKKPAATLGSPRDISDEPYHPASPPNAQEPRVRNHQRGYFDIAVAPSSMRRTPPGTPRSPLEYPEQRSASLSPPLRCNSFPPMMPAATPPNPSFSAQADSSGDSELSTPSMASPSSSRESTPSPTEPFMTMNLTATEEVHDETMSPETHYRQFLSKFCFFTGPGSSIDHIPADILPRTHSASDIEEILVSRLSPASSVQALTPTSSPPRSSSLDDLTSSRSGSLTPTPTASLVSLRDTLSTPVCH